MYAEAVYEIDEVIQCPDCYRHSNEKFDEYWFAKPCARTRHQLVYAKMSGFPYWPAKVISIHKNIYDVRFFGTVHSRYTLSKRFIKPISEDIKKLNGVNNSEDLKAALDEMEKHLELLKMSRSKFSFGSESGIREMAKNVKARRTKRDPTRQNKDLKALVANHKASSSKAGDPTFDAFVKPRETNVPKKKSNAAEITPIKSKRREHGSEGYSSFSNTGSHRRRMTIDTAAENSHGRSTKATLIKTQSLLDISREVESDLLRTPYRKNFTEVELTSKHVQKTMKNKNLSNADPVEMDLELSDDDDDDDNTDKQSNFVVSAGGQDYRLPRFPSAKIPAGHQRREQKRSVELFEKKRKSDHDDSVSSSSKKKKSGLARDHASSEFETPKQSHHRIDKIKAYQNDGPRNNTEKIYRLQQKLPQDQNIARTAKFDYLATKSEKFQENVRQAYALSQKLKKAQQHSGDASSCSSVEKAISRKLRHYRACLDLISDPEKVKFAALKLVKTEIDRRNERMRRENKLLKGHIDKLKRKQWCSNCFTENTNVVYNFCSIPCKCAYLITKHQKREDDNPLMDYFDLKVPYNL